MRVSADLETAIKVAGKMQWHTRNGGKRLPGSGRIWRLCVPFPFGRLSVPLWVGVVPLLRCFDFGKAGSIRLSENHFAKMDGRGHPLHVFKPCGKHFNLTSARFTLQSSKYAFRKQSSVPTFSARPNLVSEKLQSSFSLPFNKSSLLQERPPYWSCATLVNWPIRSRMSMPALASTCRMSRPRCSMEEPQSKRTLRY